MNLPSDSQSAFVFGLCFGINADHKVTQGEAKAFIELLRHEPRLLDAPVLRPHRPELEKLISREDLWRSHLEEAEEIIYSVLGTTKQSQAIADAPPLVFDRIEDICFGGKGLVFTGDFLMGRNQAEEIAEKLGAVVQGSTTNATSYVVVGHIPSPAWKFGKFGTKVSRGLELREGGAEIKIISEEAFCAALPPDVLDEAVKISPKIRIPGFRVIQGGTDLG